MRRCGATFVIAVLVLCTGVISSVLAGASTSLLASFVLPVTLPGSVGPLPDRVGGRLPAGAASLIAITVLWPAPVREPLRRSTARACALLARRLRAEVEYVRAHPGGGAPSVGSRTARGEPAGMTRLVNAVLVLRFTADAILRLWQSAARAPTAEHTAARAELLRAGGALVDWYERTARALAGEGPVPDPVDTGLATGRLIEAVNRDLGAADAGGTATDAGETTAGAHGAAAAIGMFWTAAHIDAVQRLQAVPLWPARAASEQCPPRSWLTGHARGHTGAPAAEVEGGYGRA
ncbi:hypothetical protein [Streptomyces sp. 6N106]|uniref:hypothetical protein n=1 Tax=Streptomyces sp. 6N106 TaxID=3457418 RepID=UPI003FD1B0B0